MTDPADVARALRPTTRLVWVETPSKPPSPNHRHRTRRPLPMRPARGVRGQHLGDPGPPSSRRPGRRPPPTRYHQVPGRPRRRPERRDRGGRTADDLLRDRLSQQQTGGGRHPPSTAGSSSAASGHCPTECALTAETPAAWPIFLVRHRGIYVVHFPGLPTHPGHAVAATQMHDFGGMLSFEVRGGKDAGPRRRRQAPTLHARTSLGGPESLIEHRASIEPPETRTPQNLLRALDRPRAPRRPDRGPRPGARLSRCQRIT